MDAIAAKALGLLAIIALGFTLKRAKVLRADDFGALSRIVLNVTVPCVIVTSFSGISISRDLLVFPLVAVAVNALLISVGFLLMRGRSREEQAFGVLNLCSYNVGAFAIPYLQGLLGPAQIVQAAMFDVGNVLTAVGLGYGVAAVIQDPDQPIARTIGRKLVGSAIFMTYVVMIVLSLLHVSLPASVTTWTGLIAQANAPLAMLMIGVGLELRLPRQRQTMVWTFITARVVAATVFTVVTWVWLPVSREAKLVLCTIFWAPVASMMPGFTHRIGADHEASAFVGTVSMIVAMVAMPITVALLANS